ncbi:MAG TPA: cation diffusion facilitator family transporter [Rubrobacteraceae bacterium]|nr:cation diffusion facilitator family transporter [Rubrobacteraceae bacterium]
MAQNNDKSGGGDGGTKKVVYAAFAANLLITISKFIAGFITGSASLLAEGAHSIADTVNQVFLLVSLRSAKSKPDRTHPYGYGKDRFFWSLIVAVGLFVAGAVFSFYEGISKILEGSGGESASFLAGYIVLGVAFVFEGASFVITTREFGKSAREEERTFREHFRMTRNTTMKVPLYEDSAALVGLLIAFAGLLFSQLSGSHVYDGIASIAIGVVLVFVAYELGRDSRALLLGEAVPPEDEERLRETITGFEEVNDIVRLLTMHLGPESVLVNAEIHVADGMDTDGIEDLIARITKRIGEQLPEVTQTFLELHPPQEEGQTAPKSD